MRLVNLTPHRLVILDKDDQTLIALPPCTAPPRLEQLVLNATTLRDHIPLHTIRYGPIDGELPMPNPDVLLVVPRVLAREIPRHDLVFPDNEIRDTEGRIIACRSLARFSSHRRPRWERLMPITRGRYGALPDLTRGQRLALRCSWLRQWVSWCGPGPIVSPGDTGAGYVLYREWFCGTVRPLAGCRARRWITSPTHITRVIPGDDRDDACAWAGELLGVY